MPEHEIEWLVANEMRRVDAFDSLCQTANASIRYMFQVHYGYPLTPHEGQDDD